MAKEAKKEMFEREYVIPLREKCRVVPRYKKTNKAVKSIKEFIARHMKVYDKDLNKIKVDKYVNEFLWARGIRNPPHQIKVKAIKQGDIVRVELVDYPDKLKFKKLRAEKIGKEAKEIKESKKTMMQKAKETMQNRNVKEDSGDQDKDGLDDKIEAKTQEQTSKKAEEKLEKEMAKKEKHEAKGEKNPAQKKKEHSKGDDKR
ncbi:MAG: 50S ribosomal protein L31e [Nanobdellota archaeon]